MAANVLLATTAVVVVALVETVAVIVIAAVAEAVEIKVRY